jgi:hypothetical protein
LAVAFDHPVAGYGRGIRVLVHDIAHRPGGAGPAGRPGQIGISGNPASRYLFEQSVYPAGKFDFHFWICLTIVPEDNRFN